MGIEVMEKPFEKKSDTDKMCHSLTNIFFCGAPRKKICDNVFYEYTRTASYISMANLMIYISEMLKNMKEQGMTHEEMVGHFQIDLKEIWDILFTSKIGSEAFLPMKIEDIINSDSPRELLKKCVRGRRNSG
jgi:hypothetical protein